MELQNRVHSFQPFSYTLNWHVPNNFQNVQHLCAYTEWTNWSSKHRRAVFYEVRTKDLYMILTKVSLQNVNIISQEDTHISQYFLGSEKPLAGRYCFTQNIPTVSRRYVCRHFVQFHYAWSTGKLFHALRSTRECHRVLNKILIHCSASLYIIGM